MATNNAINSNIPVDVAKGGTGATTLADGNVLLGSGTGAITALDVTAKGSILAGDGTTDPVALAVGTNDHVLTADSAQASGLKWAAAGGGGGGAAGYGVGGISLTDVSTQALNLIPGVGADLGQSLQTRGSISFYIGNVGATATYNDIVIDVSQGLSTNIIEIIFYDIGSDGLPNNKILESGSISCNLSGIVSTAIDTSIDAGTYWIAILVDNGNSGSNASLYAHTLNTPLRFYIPSDDFTEIIYGLQKTGTYTVGNAPTAPTGLVTIQSAGSSARVPIMALTID